MLQYLHFIHKILYEGLITKSSNILEVIIINNFLFPKTLFKRQWIITCVYTILICLGCVMTFVTKDNTEEVQEITDLFVYNGKRVEYGTYCGHPRATLVYHPGGTKDSLYYLEDFFKEYENEDVYYGVGVELLHTEKDLQEIISAYYERHLEECRKLSTIPYYKEVEKDGEIIYERNEEYLTQEQKIEELEKEIDEKCKEIDEILVERQIKYFRDQGIPAIQFEHKFGRRNLLLIVKSYKQLEDFKPHPDIAYLFYHIGNESIEEFAAK